MSGVAARDGAARRLHAIVRGVVQGVGYRATAQHEARKLGLGGWVRNLVDGAVEVEAQGEEPALQAFLSFLKQGPRGARVTNVEAEWLPAEGGAPTPFEVRRTA